MALTCTHRHLITEASDWVKSHVRDVCDVIGGGLVDSSGGTGWLMGEYCFFFYLMTEGSSRELFKKVGKPLLWWVASSMGQICASLAACVNREVIWLSAC